jgi:hypothetical protein
LLRQILGVGGNIGLVAAPPSAPSISCRHLRHVSSIAIAIPIWIWIILIAIEIAIEIGIDSIIVDLLRHLRLCYVDWHRHPTTQPLNFSLSHLPPSGAGYAGLELRL